MQCTTKEDYRGIDHVLIPFSAVFPACISSCFRSALGSMYGWKLAIAMEMLGRAMKRGQWRKWESHHGKHANNRTKRERGFAKTAGDVKVSHVQLPKISGEILSNRATPAYRMLT